MRDLSLHLLDLVQNSIRAGATLAEIRLRLDAQGRCTLVLRDDGCGMSPETAAAACSPFMTTRPERGLGLGIPMMLENARRTGGDLTIMSRPGAGTTLTVTLDTRHIDCLPPGDIAGTMAALILGSPEKPDFLLEAATPLGETHFDTRLLRQALGDVSLSEPKVIAWIQDHLSEEIHPIFDSIWR